MINPINNKLSEDVTINPFKAIAIDFNDVNALKLLHIYKMKQKRKSHLMTYRGQYSKNGKT